MYPLSKHTFFTFDYMCMVIDIIFPINQDRHLLCFVF